MIIVYDRRCHYRWSMMVMMIIIDVKLSHAFFAVGCSPFDGDAILSQRHSICLDVSDVRMGQIEVGCCTPLSI